MKLTSILVLSILLANAPLTQAEVTDGSRSVVADIAKRRDSVAQSRLDLEKFKVELAEAKADRQGWITVTVLAAVAAPILFYLGVQLTSKTRSGAGWSLVSVGSSIPVSVVAAKGAVEIIVRTLDIGKLNSKLDEQIMRLKLDEDILSNLQLNLLSSP